jgi:hypothetical protein
MASFQGILAGLRSAERDLEQRLVKVRGAIASLGTGTGSRRGRPVGSTNKPRKRRRMSAQARAAISAAQKARWAKQKASKK